MIFIAALCLFLQSIGAYKPNLAETRDMPNFTSMPAFTSLPADISDGGGLEHSASDDTLTALSRYLRPSPNPNPLEKMLTPVEERPAAEYEREHSSLSDDGDQLDIVPTSSDKLDSTIFSRSLSGQSYPSGSWHVGEIDTDRNTCSNRDSTSILSSGFDTPPRPILNSTNSMDIAEISQAQNMEDLAKALENHEEKGSSQGSDDSSTFSESVHYNRGSAFNSVASPQGSGSFSFSSAEGTPVRTMSETRKKDRSRHTDPAPSRKHLVSSISDSTTSRNAHPRWSPHSSTHSSVSGVTLSSQSSLGEEGTSSDASDKRSKLPKKYAKYDKYERYERRERSQSFDVSPERKKEVIELLTSDSEPSQRLTQDSNGTLTDGTLDANAENLTEVELSSSHSVTSTDSFYQNMNGQTPVIGKKEQHSPENEEREGGESNSVHDHTQKTLDSGTDDTNSPVSKSIGRSVCADVDVSFSDGSNPPSYKLVFASRDSMLTDSPDTDSLNDDYVNTKTSLALVHKPDEQPDKPSLILERQSRATSEETESSVGSPAHVELIIEDGRPARLYNKHMSPTISVSNEDDEDVIDFGPDISRASDIDDDDSVHEFERSGSSATPTAPRSLEGPCFSRYARVPIRNTESKSHVRAVDNPLYDTGSDLRQRACSLNDLDEPCRDEEEEERETKHTRSRRAISETRTQRKALTASLPRAMKRSSNSGDDIAGKLPQSSSAMDFLSDQSSSGAELVKARELDRPLGGSLRLEKKSKKGKGFVSKLKPALRVLKITPSSSAESKKAQGKMDSQIDKSCLHQEEGEESRYSCSDHLVPRPYEEVRRMRMMSPEVMPMEDDHPPPHTTIRRSKSSDDILDRSTDDLTDSFTEPTKVGEIVVIPEAKKPKRRRFLNFPNKKSSSSKDSSKSRDRETSKSPATSVGVQSRTRRVSVEPIMNPTASSNGNGPLEGVSQQKSPKSKRRRLPHFV